MIQYESVWYFHSGEYNVFSLLPHIFPRTVFHVRSLHKLPSRVPLILLEDTLYYTSMILINCGRTINLLAG